MMMIKFIILILLTTTALASDDLKITHIRLNCFIKMSNTNPKKLLKDSGCDVLGSTRKTMKKCVLNYLDLWIEACVKEDLK